jgi:uncharacterized protein YegP (UPF0339 family)
MNGRVFYAAGNGEEIAVSSESYVDDCQRGVEIIQQQLAKATVYEPQGS